MSHRLTVLIVGGYGTFGGRLARLLAPEPRLTLVVAGRSRDRAARFCAGLAATARFVPAAFDRDADLATQLGGLAPDIVVDATGPFQDYGEDPYRLVRAAIEAGVDYIDFADGGAFVAGIGAFDNAAKARGIHVLSGASSFPVLTAAVVRHLEPEFGRIDTITGGIAPSPYAGVGPNVIRAVAGYAGRETRVRRDGAWTSAYPLTETRRVTIAPPGRLPLASRLFSLVDVPDLVLMPALRPDVRGVWMGAAPVPEILHRMLIGLAWLVRWRIVPSLAPAAPLFHRAVNTLRWGDHRGGMVVALEGLDLAGRPLAVGWHLLAEGDDGPLIPSMAIAAIISQQLAGMDPPPGARAATDALDLGDYDRLFAGRSIVTGIRRARTGDEGLPLYRRLLGSAWDDLPPAVRALHDADGASTAEGRGSVTRGSHPLARLAAALFRFPPAGHDIPVSVDFTRDGTREVWTRRFATSVFASTHATARGGWQHLLVESFGPFAFGLALVVEAGRLHFVVRRWAVFGLPLPRWLAPVSRSWEAEIDGRFRFHVELSHRVTGLIVRYEGWLAPRKTQDPASAVGSG